MEIYKFKTNINCGGCVAKVTPFLNAENMINKWEVDIAVPEKILRVETDSNNSEFVMTAVRKAGFKIDPLEPKS